MSIWMFTVSVLCALMLLAMVRLVRGPTAADRVVACWLESQFAQTRCPLAEPRVAGRNAVLAYRRSADKRYETALRSLLLVRQAEAADKATRRARGRPKARLKLFGA